MYMTLSVARASGCSSRVPTVGLQQTVTLQQGGTVYDLRIKFIAGALLLSWHNYYSFWYTRSTRSKHLNALTQTNSIATIWFKLCFSLEKPSSELSQGARKCFRTIKANFSVMLLSWG
jgi:hypothetical protein